MIMQLDQLKEDQHKAILLYSGGFDSTLVALLLKINHISTIGLSINFLSRPRVETATAVRLAPALGFRKYIKFRLPLTDDRNSPEKWASPPYEAWFPYRNLI